MPVSYIDAAQFQEDFKDGFLTRREAKASNVDKELRSILNSPGEGEGSARRVTEAEAASYVAGGGERALINLLVLEGHAQAGLFSSDAQDFLKQKFMERLEEKFPEVNVLARTLDDFTVRFQDHLFTFSGSQGTRIELMTGYSREQSEVRKIDFFHSLFIDGPGVYLIWPDEENQRLLIPTLKQILLVRELIPKLHELGYSMERDLRVYGDDEFYLRLEAFRWRMEGEDPSNYLQDEAGNLIPSEVQEVVLKVNTVTGQIVDEAPGQLPR